MAKRKVVTVSCDGCGVVNSKHQRVRTHRVKLDGAATLTVDACDDCWGSAVAQMSQLLTKARHEVGLTLAEQNDADTEQEGVGRQASGASGLLREPEGGSTAVAGSVESFRTDLRPSRWTGEGRVALMFVKPSDSPVVTRPQRRSSPR